MEVESEDLNRSLQRLKLDTKKTDENACKARKQKSCPKH